MREFGAVIKLARSSAHLNLVTVVLFAGLAEYLIVGRYPAFMPFWMPYEFSWGVYIASSLSVAWYFRGLSNTPLSQQPTIRRKIAFIVGVVLIYVSMQTWFDYAAQHMFFIHRLQHLILHHTGPFLVALGDPGEVIWQGMPPWLQQRLRHPWLRRAMDLLQQPFLASFLFVALIYLWPMPPVHFRAMLDPRVYTVMNWSVTIDGILFWALMLDPRPRPAARLSYGTRFACCLAIMFPQILLGALVTFAERDIYPVYDICGRILSITGLEDQHYAGLILWIPSSMMSAVAAVIILNFMRRSEIDEFPKS